MMTRGLFLLEIVNGTRTTELSSTFAVYEDEDDAKTEKQRQETSENPPLCVRIMFVPFHQAKVTDYLDEKLTGKT